MPRSKELCWLADLAVSRAPLPGPGPVTLRLTKNMTSILEGEIIDTETMLGSIFFCLAPVEFGSARFIWKTFLKGAVSTCTHTPAHPLPCMRSPRIHPPSCAPHLAAPNNWRGIKNEWRPLRRRGNEELIQPCVFIWKSVTSVCMTDNDGVHRRAWEGQGWWAHWYCHS